MQRWHPARRRLRIEVLVRPGLHDFGVGEAHRNVLARARRRDCRLLMGLGRFTAAATAHSIGLREAETFDFDSLARVLLIVRRASRCLIHQN